jgi:hypothetical protein
MANIAIPFNGLLSDQENRAIQGYIRNPSDETFFKLYTSLSNAKQSIISQLMYNLRTGSPYNQLQLRHLIQALFYEERYTEVLYHCAVFKKRFGIAKGPSFFKAWARIHAGLLHTEEHVIQECVEANLENFRILNIRLGLALRSGQTNYAHELAIELWLQPQIEKNAFGFMLEAALRVDDTDLINEILQKVKFAKFEIPLSDSEQRRIRSNQLRQLQKDLQIIANRKILP